VGLCILHIQKVLPLSDRRESLVEVFTLYPAGLKSKTFDIQVDAVYPRLPNSSFSLNINC
jgi:hypothetical protein